ncbi:hypothetical protein V9T40_000648 [Parthenolecanium corni]|uniref:Uncharacterized protein n=1 Tax=Parthenolecanium corni TaxID=536013 RepID=A0AAN9Y0N4_9HEMI
MMGQSIYIGFPAAAYAAYATNRGAYSGYPSFGLPYHPAVDLTNGQMTPNNNNPMLTQALSVMSNYQAVAAQGFAPPTSPHQATTRAGYTTTNTSPGPLTEIYNSSNAENVANYVQAASPQPSGFPPIGVSRAPISYNPVCC